MQLDLTDAQIRKAQRGQTFQVTPAQMGSGIKFNLHPSNIKKLEKAYRLGKGSRLALTNGELGYNEDDEIEGAGFFKKAGKSFKKATKSVKKIAKPVTKVVKKTANKTVNKASKLAKKHVTEKNVAKYSLKGYNRLNKELEKQGMDSIHGAILNEGLGYVPFVPQSAKDIASSYAERAIDKKLEQETRRTGAGFKKQFARPVRKLVKKHVTKANINKALNKGNQIARDLGYKHDIQTMAAKKVAPRRRNVQDVLVNETNKYLGSGVKNPYLPTGLLSSGSGLVFGEKNYKKLSRGYTVYDDLQNILRKDQSGFVGQSRMESERDAIRQKDAIRGGSFTIRGGSIYFDN